MKPRVKISTRLALFSGLVFASGLTGGVARADTVISDSEAAQHVGQAVSVEGTITKVFKSRNGNTFLNFGGDYPNVTFVVWIPQDAPEAADPNLANLEGKKVKIVGTIQLYQGKPEIKVSTKEQIVIE
jgi:DNA/RNA endonuclease YhcR with UshA esterase domain